MVSVSMSRMSVPPGELRTESFHDMIEQTHMGHFHKYARKYGLVRYRYSATD
jgi:hypothetical protein